MFHKANRGSTFGRLEFCQAGENHAAQLFGQATQCPAFGFQHLFFIGFEAGLRIAQTFDHDPPEQHRQFAGQGHGRHQTAPPPGHAPIESAQGDVFAPGQAARHQAKQSAGPVAFAFDRTLAFATLMTAGGQSQPGGEMLLRRPLIQIRAHFANQLQEAVVGVRRQHGQILAATQPGQQLVQIVNLRRVDATTFADLRFDFRAARLVRAIALAQHDFHLPVAGRDLLLIMLPVFHRLPQREEMLLGPGAAQRLLDPLGFVLLDAHVTQPQQPVGIALARQNGFDDLDPAGPTTGLLDLVTGEFSSHATIHIHKKTDI